MAVRVDVAQRAAAELEAIAEFIADQSSPEQAEKWFNGVIATIESLADFPARCPIALESSTLGSEVRVLLHGKRGRGYKIFYRVEQARDVVHVLHVRHWARSTTGMDLPQ